MPKRQYDLVESNETQDIRLALQATDPKGRGAPQSSQNVKTRKLDSEAHDEPGKAAVIRIQGLPANIQLAKRIVEDVINSQSDEQLQYEIDIMPSPVFRDESVALADFATLPTFLSCLKQDPSASWRTVLDGQDLSFDQHFHGFTQLYHAAGPVRADIIALCGIDGHAYGSWQGREVPRRMWLRHFFSRDFPDCRVLIYGYKGKLAMRDSASMEDYVVEFIDALREIRKDDTTTRPIIFIAHSFGGLILVRAIIKAKQQDLEPRLSSISGIMFFAVPHRGIDVEDMTKILQAENHPRATLLQYISTSSAALKAQLQDFVGLLQNTKIISFYETEQSRRLVRDKDGQVKRAGEMFSSLLPDDAILHLPPNMEKRIPMHEDHSNIIKFNSRYDAGYIAARSQIQGILAEINQAASKSNTDIKTRNVRYMLPQTHSTNFIGREANLEELQRWYVDSRRKRLMILGLGGVGKTQLALAFCNLVKSTYSDCSIFWVSAVSRARFRQDYSNIAHHCAIPIGQDGDNAILSVKQYLDSTIAGNWLLVIDNADDPRLFDGRQDSIAYMLPQNNAGKILFTTRHMDAVLDIADRNFLDLSAMTSEEAETFLWTSLGTASQLQQALDKATAKELLTELAYLPLAIVTAASFIARKMVTITQYLARLRSTEKQVFKILLNHEFLDNTRDQESRNALAATWLMSFEQIQRENPRAADLLFFLALLENKNIPLSILPTSGSDDDLMDDIGLLMGYSFIKPHGNTRIYDMHRLVHLAITCWMQDLVTDHKGRVIDHLAATFLALDEDNISLWQEYMPHAIHVLEGSIGWSSKQHSILCLKVAKYLALEWRLQETLRWSLEGVKWCQQSLKKQDPVRLESEINLAFAYLENGNWRESIEVYRDIIQTTEMMFPASYEILLSAKMGLVSAYQHGGQSDEVLALVGELITVTERLPADDEMRSYCLFRLAQVFIKASKFKEAIELMEKVIAAESEGPLTFQIPLLHTKCELAMTYFKNEQHTAGTVLSEEVAKNVNELRSKSGSLVKRTSVLAHMCLDMGKVGLAIALLEGALRAFQGTSKTCLPQEFDASYLLARAYFANDQTDEAITGLERIISLVANTSNLGYYLIEDAQELLSQILSTKSAARHAVEVA